MIDRIDAVRGTDVRSYFQTAPLSYAIIKHRPRKPANPDRTYDPDTIPVQDGPAGTSKGTPIPVLNNWWTHIRQINNDDGYAYARSIGNMWINRYYDETTTATAEAIENGGNFVAFDKTTDTHGHMLSYSYQDAPTNILENWMNYPYLYFKAIAINEWGHLRNVGNGIDCFLPNLHVTDRWINLNDVEPFPALPYATIYGNQPVTITAYRLLGASVIGRLEDGREIYLLKSTQPAERSFLTTWKLYTVGVIPPA
jgi:hypothetical protein